jgi:hypothetical protein
VEKCPAHDEMIREVAATTEAVHTLKNQTAEVFDLIRSMSTDLTEALTRAQLREDAIQEIDNKIENGLKSSVAALSIQVTSLVSCNERRKKEREEARERGVEGFFRKGWDQFKSRLSFIIIVTTFVLISWSVIWVIQKAAIFHEFPYGLFKLFGIGG